MGQRYRAAEPFEFPNGATGWRPGGSFDCIGPYARVQNCPVILDDVEVGRWTCYATSPADTFFSIPACVQIRGRHIGGYFTADEGGPTFRPFGRYVNILHEILKEAAK